MAESYPLIRVLQQGNLVAVQPLSNSASSGTLETLSVDLQTGTVTLLQKPPITATGIISALGLLGLAKLQTGTFGAPIVTTLLAELRYWDA